MDIAMLQAEIEDDLDRFERDVKDAVGAGRETWMCPVCNKVRCLFGELCFYCRAEERDYRDQKDMESQLRRGG